MPRIGNITFIPKSEPGTAATLTAEQIPQEIKDEVEEIYTALKTASGRMHVAFDTKLELSEYVRQVTSYCATRPAGAIRFRKSPVKGQADTEMSFRIVDIPVESEKATADIREGVEAVKEAVKIDGDADVKVSVRAKK